MSSLTSARAALLQEHGGDFLIADIELESPRADEVLVRMVAAGICHTDLVFRDAETLGLPTPCVLGHEGAGIVEAVGKDVTGLAPGDHVVLSYMSCGVCPSCSAHRPSYCYEQARLNYGGGRGSDGTSPIRRNGRPVAGAFFNQSSFATMAITGVRNAVKVPPELPLDVLAPLGCGFQTGIGAAVNSIGVKPGQSLAIFGGGGVGLSALLGALSAGGGDIIIVEPIAQRRALALDLGAARAIDPLASADLLADIRDASGGGVDHAIETSGIVSNIGVAAEAVLPTGIVGILGMTAPDAMLPVAVMSMMSRGVTIKGIVEGDADPQQFIPAMAALFARGRLPIDRLITRYPFADINRAVTESLSGKAIKPVLIF